MSLAASVALALAAACGGTEAPAPAAGPVVQEAPRVATVKQAEVGQGLCSSVLAAEVAPGWLTAPVVATANAPGAGAFAAGAGTRAVVVLQNGDGAGAGEATTGEVLLSGQPVATISPGTRAAATLVTLGAQNSLAVHATGPGSVRATIAALPGACPLLDQVVTRSAGAPRTDSFSVASPDAGTIGVLLVENGTGGAGAVLGSVEVDGVPVAELKRGGPHTGWSARAVVLGAQSTVTVKTHGVGGSVRVVALDADTTPPALDLLVPADGGFTASPVAASGTAGLDATAVDVEGVAATLASGAFQAELVRGDGPIALTATARDFCGNRSRDCHAITVDGTAPVITVAGVVDGEVIAADVTPVLSAADALPVTLTATLDGAPFTSGTTVTAEGEHDLSVVATDAAGNSSTALVHFAIDRTAPSLSIQGVADGSCQQGPVSPAIVAADPHLGAVLATLDGASFESGSSVTGEGQHELLATATDSAGNEATARAAFTLDRTAPVVSIAGVAEGAYVQGPVTLAATAADASAVTVTATLGGQPYGGEPVSAEGLHQLAAVATDCAGNQGAAGRSFTIDRTPPVVAISGVTDGERSRAAAVTPTFTASDSSPVVVVATLDGAPFASGTPVASEGEHVLVVTGTDAAGNGATSTVRFTLDRIAPALVVAGVSDGLVTTADVTPAFSATDALPVTLTATLDGAPFISGTTITAEGEHDLSVVATDAAGNSSTALVHFAIDRTAPSVSVQGVADGSCQQGPVSPAILAADPHLASVAATLDGAPFESGTTIGEEGQHELVATAADSAGNEASAAATFTLDRTAPAVTIDGVAEGAYVQGPVTLAATIADASPVTTTVLLDGQPYAGSAISAEGAHTLQVEAEDCAGNHASATRVFVIDTTPPELSVTGVADGEHSRAPSVAPVFTASDSSPTTTTATLDGTPFVSGTGVTAEGQHVLAVSAQDAAGNSAALTVTFTIDRTPPAVTLAGVLDGERRNTAATVTFTATDANPVEVTATADGGVFESGGTIDGAGGHTVSLTATDRAGNVGQASVSFTIDRTPPELAIVAPAPGSVTASSSVELEATATDDGPPPELEVSGAPLARGADGQYRGTLQLVEGTNGFVVVARDTAGNEAQAPVNVTRDSTAPVLSVEAPVEGARLAGTTTEARGHVQDATAVTVTVAGVQAAVAADGTFTVTVGVGPGATALLARAVDAAGNATELTRNVRANADRPLITVLGPTDGLSTTAEDVVVHGTVVHGDPTDTVQVTVSGVSAAVAPDGSFSASVGLSAGANLIEILATDGYGLTATATLTVTLTTGEPDGGTPDGGTPDGGTPDGGTPDGGTPDGGTPDGGTPDGGNLPPAGPAPQLHVELPQDGAVLGGISFGVAGYIEGGTLPLQVTVAGVPATVSGRQFTTALGLAEGPHDLELLATDASGRTATARRLVTVDRTAPFLTITRPAASPAAVSESPYLLQGTVGDPTLAGVTVDGQPILVLGGGFSTPVSLPPGETDVVVEARDLAGNRSSFTQRFGVSGVAPSVVILDPLDGSEADGPLVSVQIRVTAAAALTQVTIGAGAATPAGADLYTATVSLALGENLIRAVATDANGLSGSAEARVRYRDPAQEPLAVTGVDPAPGATGVEPDSLVSVAFNKAVDPDTIRNGEVALLVDGVPLSGGFSIAPGAQTVTFIASRPLPLGAQLTLHIQDVLAQVGPGLAGQSTSGFTVRRPLTTVHGLVTDEQLTPLGGVKVELEGQALSTTTAADGNWVLFGAAGGSGVVRYEGGTDSAGRSYPTVRRSLFIEAEGDTVEPPLMLVPTDGASAEYADAAGPIHLGFGGRHAGLTLDLPARGLAFPGGATVGTVTATELPGWAVPVPFAASLGAGVMFQLGPSELSTQGGATVSLPNRSDLPPGRRALILAHDPGRLVIEAVGLAQVSADGLRVESDGSVPMRSLSYLGYMPLTQAQHDAVEAVLAGTPPGASGALLPTELLRHPERLLARPPWQLLPVVLWPSQAHAAGEAFPAISAATQLADNSVPAQVIGTVRTAHAPGLVLELAEPALEAPVDLPVTPGAPILLALRAAAAFPPMSDQELAQIVNQTVDLHVAATGPGGTTIAAPQNEAWSSQGHLATELPLHVELLPGSSELIFEASASLSGRQLVVRAELTLVSPVLARVTLHKVSDTQLEGQDSLSGTGRLARVPVRLIGGTGDARRTGQAGDYAMGSIVPYERTEGIVCAEVGLGVRSEARVDELGATKGQLVPYSFASCSPPIDLSPGRQTSANVLVDVRLLTGGLRFRHRDGTLLPGTCRADEASATTQWDETTGELTSIKPDDVATTEVHFFRADDLDHPIAKYAFTAPRLVECTDQEMPGTGEALGQYARVRVGPVDPNEHQRTQTCLAAERQGQTDSAWYRAECGEARSGNRVRLQEGDRLVAVAVNHATGYTGTVTVSVPPISPAPVGGCPADATLGLQEVHEPGEAAPLTLSRCLVTQLEIPANIDLFPPEIEVSVERAAKDEGVQRSESLDHHLVRTGGMATTRDEVLRVMTRWRVRTRPAPAAPLGDPGAGGTGGAGGVAPAAVDCAAAGGERCRASAIDDGLGGAGGTALQRGGLLERFCGELPLDATEEELARCEHEDRAVGPGEAALAELVDVPTGVPPLAGRLLTVTQDAVQDPSTPVFEVSGGKRTSWLEVKSVGGTSLVAGTHYVHVVGNALLPRDTNGDGVIDPATEPNLDADHDGTVSNEERANQRPPDFRDDPDDATHPGRPKVAVALKNVYRSYVTPGGRLTERFDRAREHEFRVIDLQTPASIGVTTASHSSQPLLGDPPAATADDISYELLLQLLAPVPDSRADTPSGHFVVRLGGDAYGTECDLVFDTEYLTISGTCGGEDLQEILSANDILYLELYLSGNAENVLYRFNFYGISPRKDFVTAGGADTLAASTTPDAPGDDHVPAAGRQVSEPAVGRFFVRPAQLESGTVLICLDEFCSDPDRILKELVLSRTPENRYTVDERSSTIPGLVVQAAEADPNGAIRFAVALPPELASMTGREQGRAVFVRTIPQSPPGDPRVQGLGMPKGKFESVAARAPGQQVVAGVNLSDGHLTLTTDDIVLPEFASEVRFTRTYNNQANDPTPLGNGWSHSYDGFVIEERLGRYTVVLGGQSTSFPHCERVDPRAGTAEGCLSDRTHGGTLTVDVVPGPEPRDHRYTLEDAAGRRFVFERESVGNKRPGRVRTLLSRFEDGHGADPAGGDGWVTLRYRDEADLLEQATRPGGFTIDFSYDAIDLVNPLVPNRLKRLSANVNFELLHDVTFRVANLAHTVTFKHDLSGNLTEVTRDGDPMSKWVYRYLPVPEGTRSEEVHALTNELEFVERYLSAPGGVVADVLQYQASYERIASVAPYRNVNAFEVVDQVVLPGQKGIPFTFGFTTGGERTVQKPDDVLLTADLNGYGNARSLAVSDSGWAMTWGSEEPGGAAFPRTRRGPAGRELTYERDEHERVEGVTLTAADADGSAVGGVAVGDSLWAAELNSRFGRPDSWTEPRVGGAATFNMPLNDAGDPGVVSVIDASYGPLGTTEFNEVDDNGVVTELTDATTGVHSFIGERDRFGRPLQEVVTRAAADGARGSLTRNFTTDELGRVTSIEEVETGSKREWSYDSLGRVTMKRLAGDPVQTFRYAYAPSENALTVTETLDELPDYRRVRRFADGLLESETTSTVLPEAVGSVSDPEVSTGYEYVGGRLAVFIDERGFRHKYIYEDHGWLTTIEVENPVANQGFTFERSYGRDLEGKVTSETDAAGRITTTSYDQLGRAVKTSWGSAGDGAGEDSERLVLDAGGAVTRRTLGSAALGTEHVFTYARDALGRVRRVTSGDDYVSQTQAFDGAGRPTTSTDLITGLEETREYEDVLGRLTTRTRTVETDTGTNSLTERRTYADTAMGTTVTSVEMVTGTGSGAPRTRTRTFVLDQAGRLRREEETAGGVVVRRTYVYDALGNRTTETHPAGTVTRTYDAAGRLAMIVDEVGATTTLTLDGGGLVVGQVGPHPQESWSFSYDSAGQILSRTLAAAGTTPAATWRYGRIPAQIMEEETAPGGYVTRRYTNGRGLLLREERPDIGSTNLQTITFRYDGPWQQRMETTEGGSSHIQTALHDDRGRPRVEVDRWSALGQAFDYETQTVWTGRSAVITEKSLLGTAVTRTSNVEVDSLGNVLTREQGDLTDRWGYDADGWLAWEAPAGQPVTEYRYAESRLSSVVTGAETTSFGYDAAGRRNRITEASDRERLFGFTDRGEVEFEEYGDERTEFTYNAGGGLLTRRSGGGGPLWTFDHGPRGELRSVTLPPEDGASLGVALYRHDARGTLVEFTPPGGSMVAETYATDYLGRSLLRTRGTSNWTTTWVNGESETVDPNQDVVRRLVDGRGRQARVQWQPGAASAPGTDLIEATYRYDFADQPLSAVETRLVGTVTETYGYDSRGRLTSRTRDGATGVAWAFEPTSDRVARQSTTSGGVDYTYDGPQGRLATLDSGRGATTRLTWEPGGERLLLTEGGGLFERRCYDSSGRTASITHDTYDVGCEAPAASPTARFGYTYDSRGNRLTETYTDDSTGPSGETTEYGHDAADRLVGVRYPEPVTPGQLDPPTRSVLYRLGGDGTRLGEKRLRGYAGALTAAAFAAAVALPADTQALTYLYDTQGAIHEVREAPSALVASYTADPAGRMTGASRDGEVKQLQWDADGRLAAVTIQSGPDTRSVGFGYDHQGQRVQKVSDTGTTRWVHGDGGVLEEQPPAEPARVYERAGSLLTAVGNDRLAGDALGSVTTRAAGGSAALQRYDAWGEFRGGKVAGDGTLVYPPEVCALYGDGSACADRWHVPTSGEPAPAFAGQEWEADIGLSHAGDRWYDPKLGQFLSQDPVYGDPAMPGTMAPFAYAAGAPTRYVDPDGTFIFVPMELMLLRGAINRDARIPVAMAKGFYGAAYEFGAQTASGGAAKITHNFELIGSGQFGAYFSENNPYTFAAGMVTGTYEGLSKHATCATDFDSSKCKGAVGTSTVKYFGAGYDALVNQGFDASDAEAGMREYFAAAKGAVEIGGAVAGVGAAGRGIGRAVGRAIEPSVPSSEALGRAIGEGMEPRSTLAGADATGGLSADLGPMAGEGGTTGGMRSSALYEGLRQPKPLKAGGPSSLLPDELKAGRYRDLPKPRGDQLTPHHMPSAEYMLQKAGIDPRNSLAMNVHAPRLGGRHVLTESFGRQPFLDETFRTTLARDIRDLRRIYRADGAYTPQVRKGLQDFITQSQRVHPQLFER